MSIEREEKLIRAFFGSTGTVLYNNLPNLEARISKVKAELEKANLEVYALRRAKPGERYISNNTTFDVWTDHLDCYGPRLIVRKRRVPTATGRLTVSAPAIQEIPRKKVATPPPFEKRFFNESSITYETAPGQGFEVSFGLEDREVTITHVTEKSVKTYSAKAHPEDQYDEQFGFELAAARFWTVSREAIRDFILFRAYVWGVKGWGVIDLTKFERGERWPHLVDTLLAASKEPSFRQRVVAATNPDEKPLSLIRQELAEEGLDVTLAEDFLKQYREWGFEPVAYRPAKEGEWVGSVFSGTVDKPRQIGYNSRSKLQIFRKRS